MATLTDAGLDEERPSPRFVRSTPHFPVRQCLWIIINEEWHHHRFAVRDLDSIGADAPES